MKKLVLKYQIQRVIHILLLSVFGSGALLIGVAIWNDWILHWAAIAWIPIYLAIRRTVQMILLCTYTIELIRYLDPDN